MRSRLFWPACIIGCALAIVAHFEELVVYKGEAVPEDTASPPPSPP